MNALWISRTDFSRPEEYRRFRESAMWKEKYDKYVQFVIEKLYELDERQSVASTP